MDIDVGAQKILNNRAFLLDSCSATVGHIRELRSSSKPDALQLLGRLGLEEDSVSSLARALLDRGAKLDVTDIVGALSDKFNSMHVTHDEFLLNEKRKEELFNANAEKINDFFKDMDRSETANTSSDLFLDRHREQQQLSSSGVSDAPAPRLAPKVGECDYDLMLRLTGQWGKWTGNVPISHDMQRIGVGKGGRGAATSESAEFIKIPFKPFIWQKGGRLKGQLATDTNIHATESSASPEEMHPPGFAGAHARSHGCTTTAEELLTESLSPVQHQGAFQQAAYGATHYEVPMESPYWENLTLTECLMASPYFQHLTSDKFRALDHFAVARSYNDQDTVLEQHQKFYSVYFVRRGAVKVLKPLIIGESRAAAPEAVIQLLQSGDFFGFECTSNDSSSTSSSPSSSRFHYQACGDNVECYAIPVEYFTDICLKVPLSYKTAPVKVNMYLESDPTAPDAAQANLAIYALSLQETRGMLREMALSGSSLSTTVKAEQCASTAAFLQRFDQLVNPELDFAEVADSLIATSRDILNVDRVCLYLIDRKTSTMTFFGLPPANLQRQMSNLSVHDTTAQSIYVGEGVASSLGGIIDHVVQHACSLNIANFSTSDLFDPSIEKRTASGKRIKHLLLVPVFDRAGHVTAVLQFSNPKGGREGFSEVDVKIAESISSKVSLVKMCARNTATFIPVHALPTDSLTFRLDHLIMPHSNRHLKGTVQLYIGNQPYGAALATTSVATYPIMGDLQRADFKQDISFHHLHLSDLPVTTKIIFSFESTNHHPIVWCGLYLFDYLRRLQQSECSIIMWDGGPSADLTDMPAVLEGLPYAEPPQEAPGASSSPKGGKKSRASGEVMQCSNAVLTICLQDHQTTILHTSPGVVKYHIHMGLDKPAAINPLSKEFALTPVPLAPGASAVEWYLRQLLPTELSIFMALKKIVDVINPSDIDSETSRLVWRMRNALCAECSWALPWFLLCCDWTHKARVEETHRLLYSWASVTPLLALRLLDSRFRDPKVRAFAVGIVGQLSEAEFCHCLHHLVYCLRFETHCDSALARFLLRRALANPNTTGKQMLWYLHCDFAREPVAYVQAQRLLKIYLRSLSSDDRAHQGHGLYALQRIDTIYRGIASSNLFPPHRTPDPERVVEVLLSELNQNPWPSEFTMPVPTSQDLHTTGVVQCKKLPNIPHSFILTLKYPDHPSGRILYSRDINIRTEMLYQHMLRTFDLVWQQENVELSAVYYEAFVIGNTGAIAQNVVAGVKPIMALAVAAAENASAAAAGWGSSFSTKAKAVSESLLNNYFDELPFPSAAGSGSSKPDAGSTKAAFAKSLAVFVIVNQVLSLRDVSMFNAVLTPRGDLFVQNPTSVLGYEQHHSADTKSGKGNKYKTDTLFYMRCFENVLGAADSPVRSDFVNLMAVAFLSLRKHVTFLLWSLGNTTHQIGLSAPQSAECGEILKERLLLTLGDDAALSRLDDILQRSMNVEPTVSAADAANVSTSMKYHQG